MSVVPLHFPPAERPATHFIPQAAARNSFSELEGAFNALKRAMSGPSTPEAMRGEIQRLTREIQVHAAAVGRFIKP